MSYKQRKQPKRLLLVKLSILAMLSLFCLTSRQRYVALTGATPLTALNEGWEVRLYNVGQGDTRYFMFDVVATQQCATSSPLILEEYRYGGMGVRGHRDWKDKSRVVFLTSEGKTRANGNATRGRWCHIGGPVDTELVGSLCLPT